VPRLPWPFQRGNGRPGARRGWTPLPFALLLVAALLAPRFANEAWTQMLVFVAIYVGLGLGLNVVVGFAGDVRRATEYAPVAKNAT
jgi:hypothetical protein